MAFDASLTPVASTPATTSETALFTASADSSVLVDVVNLSTSSQTFRLGIKPSGGSTHWKVYGLSLAPSESALAFGVWFLQNGDAVQVQSGSTGSVLSYSLTGLRS